MILTDAWFLLVGLASGLASGLLGLGGGLIVVPALVALGVVDHAAEAVGTSVFVILVNALVGTWRHAARGNVRVRRGLTLAAGAVPLAFAGGCFVRSIPEALLRGLYATLLLAMAILLGRLRRPQTTPRPSGARRGGALAVGALSGLMAGVFGVGGGTVLVPMQVVLMGADMLSAAATSLLVIVVSSSVALVAHGAVSHTVHWAVGAWIVAGGIVGASLGVRLAQRLGNQNLQRVFMIFLFLLSAVMFAETAMVL